jgi:hypothetical protein
MVDGVGMVEGNKWFSLDRAYTVVPVPFWECDGRGGEAAKRRYLEDTLKGEGGVHVEFLRTCESNQVFFLKIWPERWCFSQFSSVFPLLAWSGAGCSA